MSRGAPANQVVNITAPIVNEITALSATSTCATQDLSKCGPQPAPGARGDMEQNGCVDKYVELHADGGDIYFAFGPSAASVGSLSASTTGVNAANAAQRIPSGASRFLRPTKTYPFLGYVCATGVTATLRITASSD